MYIMQVLNLHTNMDLTPVSYEFTAKFLRIVCFGGIFKFSPVPEATIFSRFTAKFEYFETFGGNLQMSTRQYEAKKCFIYRQIPENRLFWRYFLVFTCSRCNDFLEIYRQIRIF